MKKSVKPDGKSLTPPTLEEAIAELKRATLESEEGVFTTTELCQRLGYGMESSAVGRRMKQWVAQGLIEYAGYVSRPGIDRKMRPVPAYRWIGDRQQEKGGE